LPPRLGARAMARSTAARWPLTTTWRVVVGGGADFALRGLRRDFLGDREVEPEQGRHGAFAHRNGLLHGLATQLQEARGIGQAEGAGGGQSGIFTERVTGNEAGGLVDLDAAFLLKDAQDGDADRH
jgi:hypothetical protein